jgi:hypothetical protein
MGSSGFSSGEDDLENYNTSLVVGEVREPLRPALTKLLNICAMKVFGAEHRISYQWAPLREMSSEQAEQVKSSKHLRYAADLDRGIITPEEYGIICHQEKLIPIETAAQRGEIDKEDLATFMALEGDDTTGDAGGKDDGGKGGKKGGGWVRGPAGGMRKKSAGGGWEYQHKK